MPIDFGSRGVKSAINVTPLVDVVLVLLIVFMVVTPLLQRGKPVELPRARRVSELGRGGDPIVLSVTADGSAWLDGTRVERSELSRRVSAEVTARPGAPIVVRADRSLDYKVVRELVLELSKARVNGVSLAATQAQAGTP